MKRFYTETVKNTTRNQPAAFPAVISSPVTMLRTQMPRRRSTMPMTILIRSARFTKRYASTSGRPVLWMSTHAIDTDTTQVNTLSESMVMYVLPPARMVQYAAFTTAWTGSMRAQMRMSDAASVMISWEVL